MYCTLHANDDDGHACVQVAYRVIRTIDARDSGAWGDNSNNWPSSWSQAIYSNVLRSMLAGRQLYEASHGHEVPYHIRKVCDHVSIQEGA